MIDTKNKQDIKSLFNDIKDEILCIDPVYFCEQNLTLDQEPFRLSGNGWKFMADVYRYIALKATSPDGKPVVIVKGRQVGATVMAAALDLYFTSSGCYGVHNSSMRVLHAFPSLILSKRFSQEKLENLIASAKPVKGAKPSAKRQTENIITSRRAKSESSAWNLTIKQFEHECTLFVESLGDDSDRVMGMSIDVLLCDEVQKMTKTALGNVTKTLTASKYGRRGDGVQVYFGTPRLKGSHFETMWNMSDKRYYHLNCSNCHEYYMFYTPGSEEWEKIWVNLYNVQCPKCGNIQHKIEAIENGKWVATEPLDDIGNPKPFVGFHISQIFRPDLTKEKLLNEKPINNPTKSEREYYNEVLGEFYSGTGVPMTPDIIYDNCRDADRKFSRYILKDERQTYLGVDWGGKVDNDSVSRGQSYSSVVILSDIGNDILQLEHCHKMIKQDFTHKYEVIKEAYKRFCIKIGVADWFFGQDVVGELQKLYGDRFLGTQASGQLAVPVKYRPDELMISFNKDVMLEEIFGMIRRGKIRFPYKDIEHFSWLIDHICSMEEKYVTRNGIVAKTYAKGNSPNDGLIALMNAYIAYKFNKTRGFKLNPNNPRSVTSSLPLLAYVPRM